MKDYIDTSVKRNSNILRVNFERDDIFVSPDYQRNGDIWTLEKRQLLIDSIMNDFDIPKIYFHELNENQKKGDKKYAIIDGRQRLETIWRFIDNDFPLSGDFIYFKDRSINANGMTYGDLAIRYPSLKMFFDSYELPIILVNTDDIDLIDDMFLRLNEAVPLNAAEKRNAIGGSMSSAINQLSNHKFFKKCVRFGNKRYQHKEVSARLLFLIHSLKYQKRILDTKKVYLDSFVKLYKENKKLNFKIIYSSASSILDAMFVVFTEKDILLTSQSSIPIYFLIFDKANKTNSTITRDSLVKFKEDIQTNKILAETDITKVKFTLLEYDRLSQQGTNDASSIKERFGILINYLRIGNYVDLLAALSESKQKEKLTDLLANEMLQIDGTDEVSGAIAMTNATGFYVDDINIDDIEFCEEEILINFTFQMSGDQIEDKPFCGNQIIGKARATVDGEKHVQIEIDGAGVNRGDE